MRALDSSLSTLMNGMTAMSPAGIVHGPHSAQATANLQRNDDLPPRLPTRNTHRRRPDHMKRSNWARHQGEVL